ncbi:MAG: VRR-NUC domain-containing protein [Magnetospirillum sp.]|nr:VRR-NUC domain-containing protein [Magnetospirillum sp.]
MSETAILRTIHLAAGGLPGVRLFRNQVGHGAAGQIIGRPGPGLLVVRGNPVTMGLAPGSPDLIGWRTLTVTDDMVGQRIAVFVGLEVKTATGRASPEQRNFIDVLDRAGGIAAIVRDKAEAVQAVTTPTGRAGQ